MDINYSLYNDILHTSKSLLILSNLALIPVIVSLFLMNDIIDSFLFLVLMISSMLYHACVDMDVCIIHKEILIFLDLTLAGSIITCLSLIYASNIDHSFYMKRLYKYDSKKFIDCQIKIIFIIIIISINGIWITYNNLTSTLPQRIFTVLYSLSIIMFSLYRNLYRRGQIIILKKKAFIGIVLGVIGYMTFELGHIECISHYYWLVHSMWHIFSSLSVYMLVRATCA